MSNLSTLFQCGNNGWIIVANPIINKSQKIVVAISHQRFKAIFGLDTWLCELLWLDLIEIESIPKKTYLLWALLFLKCYASETVHAALTGVTEKTFRKWAWFVVNAIAKLGYVRSHLLCALIFVHSFLTNFPD